MNKFKSDDLLRIFLGLIFLSAGIYRILNWRQAILEFSKFDLDSAWYLIVLMIILEVVGGLFLIFNIKIKETLIAFIIFIILALIAAFLTSGQELISEFNQLFTFSPTPTDIFLHFTYLIVLVYLILKKIN